MFEKSGISGKQYAALFDSDIEQFGVRVRVVIKRIKAEQPERPRQLS